MFPREVKEIDGKQYIEYKGFQEMRDRESKVEGEKIELFKENKKLKEENKKLKEDNNNLQTGPFKYSYVKKIQNQNKKLEKENEDLKGKIELLYIFLEDRETSIKKLEEELKPYKKQYEHTMGEDYIDKDLYDLDC